MTIHIDYYVSLNSPWVHLGSERFEATVARHAPTVAIWPVDFATVFAGSGGLPLPKRAPARQAYRMMELRRWREALGVPIVLEPAPFPMAEALAAHCAIALRETRGQDAAIRFAHRALKALWQEEADTGRPEVVARLADELGHDGRALVEAAADPRWAERRAADTQAALARGVFGAPSYVVADEVFWGQDRLDFVERRLVREGGTVDRSR